MTAGRDVLCEVCGADLSMDTVERCSTCWPFFKLSAVARIAIAREQRRIRLDGISCGIPPREVEEECERIRAATIAKLQRRDPDAL